MSKRKLQAIGYEKDFIDLEGRFNYFAKKWVGLDDNVYRNFVCEMETRYLQTKDDAWIQSVLKTEKTEEWNKKLNDVSFSSFFVGLSPRSLKFLIFFSISQRVASSHSVLEQQP